MPDPGRILIADESGVSRQVAAAMVEHLGCLPTVVADGPAAIRVATGAPFELILMSLALPGIGGAEVAARIRAVEQGRRTPILAVLAADESAEVDARFDGLLSRPFGLAAMTEAVRRWTAVIPPTRPPLDDTVVSALVKIGDDLGEDLWSRLVELFLADAGSWLPAMRTAASSVDAGALFRAAHTLCGSSANLGASHLATLCSTLAQDRVVEDTAGTAEAIDAVEAELARVVDALRVSVS